MTTDDRRPRRDARDLRADPSAPVVVISPGTVPYGTAWDWQRDLTDRRAADEIRDTLVLLEHPRTYTAGKRADAENLVFDESERARRGIELFHVDRGGDFTYHGPGQLVAYPIMKLAGPRVVDHVRALEEIGLEVLASYGITGERVDGFTGVWVGNEKIMAIGVRVSSGYVTQHGLAINVTTDLTDFSGIVPCGITDKGVCSLASLGVQTTVTEVAERLQAAFAEVYGATLEPAEAHDLGLAPSDPATA